MRRCARLAAVAGLLAAGAVHGGENEDLDLIPGTGPAIPPPPATAAMSAVTGRIYGQDAFTAWSPRSSWAVAPPPEGTVYWHNRASVDGIGHLAVADDLSFTLSDRFNGVAENDIPIPSHGDFRNDLREAYVTWEIAPEIFLDGGRINERNGVALGFNPTDVFRASTQVDLASLDPSVLREDRLGVGMLRGQILLPGAAFRLAFAPKLGSPPRLTTGEEPSVDPQFDRTNDTTRLMLAATADLGGDVSPQAMLLVSDGQPRIGASISRAIGEAFVAYGEWLGGRGRDEVGQAVRYGQQTGTFPAAFVNPEPAESFENDVAVGGSWTSESKLTINLEYHYHQAGWDRQQWDRWFALGRSSVQQSDLFWYVREFAADRQDPPTRQELFLRLDQADALIRDLELTAIAFVDIQDGSVTTQWGAAYYLSAAWTISGFVSASVGAPRSDRGSLPQEGSAILQVTRYF